MLLGESCCCGDFSLWFVNWCGSVVAGEGSPVGMFTPCWLPDLTRNHFSKCYCAAQSVCAELCPRWEAQHTRRAGAVEALSTCMAPWQQGEVPGSHWGVSPEWGRDEFLMLQHNTQHANSLWSDSMVGSVLPHICVSLSHLLTFECKKLIKAIPQMHTPGFPRALHSGPD